MQLEKAAADFDEAIRLRPENLQFRYIGVLSLLALGDKAGLRRACSDLLDRFGTVTNPGPPTRSPGLACSSRTRGPTAWSPMRLAETALAGFPKRKRPS